MLGAISTGEKKKMFKKKKMIDDDIFEKIENLKEYCRQLRSDYNFGYISENEYISKIRPIVDGIDAMEIAKKELSQEEFDKAVHDMIESIFVTTRSPSLDWKSEYVSIVRTIGSATFGKERWFYQENGLWHDRKDGDYIDFVELDNRIYKELSNEE